ncbi:hypothetical protein MNB_SV-12-104 [hydrothermal vent metagenome]|uniref:LysM domain-containing protein n=1 Tax=hydrothermal vent metagenome TaxID=652676 RepID=A0A1W1BDU3_9ZZZZ
MFNIEEKYEEEQKDTYLRETEFASINHEEDIYDVEVERSSKKILFMSLIALSAIGVMGYFGYDYIQGQNISKKTAVMGVTYRATPSMKTEMQTQKSMAVENRSRDKIEESLNNMAMEAYIEDNIKSIVDEFKTQKQVSHRKTKDISQEIDSMVENFYNQKAIPMELDNMVDKFYTEDEERNPKERVVIVKEGDTLGLISKRFYGSPMKFQKIIDSNPSLRKKSNMLYIGQKLHVPY